MKSKRTFYRKRAAKKTKPTKSLKTYVKRFINRQLETKDKKYQTPTLEMANFANTTDRDNNTIELTPNSSTLAIQQGTAESQRVGNRITTTSAYLKLRIFPNPYDAVSNSVPIPQVVMGIIWSIKAQDQTLNNAQAIAANYILQNNNASSGFQGNLSDWMRDYNTDMIKVHKVFNLKVGASAYNNNSGVQNNVYNFTNNDFKLCILKTINLTKFYPKKVNFNDADNDANSKSLYLTLSPCDADGGSNASTTSAIPLQWEYGLHLRYKDA